MTSTARTGVRPPWGLAASLVLAPGGCVRDALVLAQDQLPEATSTTSPGTGSTSSGGPDIKLDTPPDGDPTCGNIDLGCTQNIDLLFVIDNSGSTGEEQLNLARNFPLLIDRLENLTDKNGTKVNPDVQIMVTTTDFGHPLCNQFQEHPPEKGAPISDGCNSRIDRFTGLGQNAESIPEACTNACPVDITPYDPFIHFWGSDSLDNNVPDVGPADINGDGTPDSEVARALACIGPQGINGCGYESPLENMIQALNPNAPWNQGAGAFLRDDALLAIVLITDEADCSVKDYTIFDDPALQQVHPDLGYKATSSAICWAAGVACNGPDQNGVYTGCTAVDDAGLQPTDRYVDFLVEALREQKNKEVIMLGILGVPPVTEHLDSPPFQPTAGGIMDLVYRNWRDPDYPNGGDILPDEWASGKTAAHKQFEFGIGPGCTGFDPSAMEYTGQAVPPVRIREVCEALNIDNGDGTTDVRCCIESICDTDFSLALECLTGTIGETIVVPG